MPVGVNGQVPTTKRCWFQFGNTLNGNLTESNPPPSDGGNWDRVGMSADGNIIFFKGSDVGGTIVKVMKYNTSTRRWDQLGSSIKSGEIKGATIIGAAISSDGNNVVVMSAVGVRSEVRVYKLARDDWVQVGARIFINEVSYGYYANQVDISRDGSVIAIASASGGFVRLYKLRRSPIRWEQLGSRITSKPTPSWDINFPEKIALSADGTVVAIGAFLYDQGGGVIYIYKYNSSSSNWVQLGSLLPDGDDIALSPDGMTVAVASTFRLAVYKFSLSASRWLRFGPDVPITQIISAFYDSPIAMSADGRTVAHSVPNINAPYYKGHVSVYTLINNSSWSRVDINGTGNVEYFGYHTAMSDDGTKLVISAQRDRNVYAKPDPIEVKVFELKQC
jgi:hypothetical protein